MWIVKHMIVDNQHNVNGESFIFMAVHSLIGAAAHVLISPDVIPEN